MTLDKAVTEGQIEQWHRDGAVIVEDFFSSQEIAPIYAD